MSRPVIRVEGLSKRYRIGQQQRYHTLRDVLARSLSASVRRIRGNSKVGAGKPTPEYIWALKEVSFEVGEGEVIGIIGRNGSGKSTLLKVLSRITRPTEGYAEIHGRVGSLLEVTPGFHPELTGHENIYLSGALLGMKKAEIDRKFDEIVAFAEVEQFVDTAMKYYSSGMYVRLGFAVAAHLEPEILLVDEVLAVGDAAFQKKCLGKMGDAAKGGRTVLFVSHQMNQIRRLCERCIWLDAGRVKKSGATTDVVSAYESAVSSMSLEENRDVDDSHVAARFINWQIVEPAHEQPNVLASMGPVTLCFSLKVNRHIRSGHHGIALFNNENQLMWATAVNHLHLAAGVREFVYTLPSLPLRPGIYYWKVSLYDEGDLVDEWYCAPEMVIGTLPTTHALDRWQGVLNLPCDFQVL